MPFYFFRIQNGPYSGACDHGTELADRNAAWKELTSVCGDMVGSISRKLEQNSEWQMELLDEAKTTVVPHSHRRGIAGLARKSRLAYSAPPDIDRDQDGRARSRH